MNDMTSHLDGSDWGAGLRVLRGVAARRPGKVVEPTSPLNRDVMYLCAYNYAQGVRDTTPAGYDYGVSSDEDLALFATAYADHHNNKTVAEQVPMPSAFGQWRAFGEIEATD